MNKKQALLIFGRHPRPGHVKTRLGRTLGMEEACRIYASLLRYTFDVAKTTEASVFFAMPPDEEAFAPLYRSQGLEVFFQRGLTLGDRMQAAFDDHFAQGFHAIVLLGSDCPFFTTALLQDAFASLESSDVVFGPALDGGYTLVGQKGRSFRLFEGIAWSTPRVWSQTKDLLASQGLTPALLPSLRDIDDTDDLAHYAQNPGPWPLPPEALSWLVLAGSSAPTVSSGPAPSSVTPSPGDGARPKEEEATKAIAAATAALADHPPPNTSSPNRPGAA